MKNTLNTNPNQQLSQTFITKFKSGFKNFEANLKNHNLLIRFKGLTEEEKKKLELEKKDSYYEFEFKIQDNLKVTPFLENIVVFGLKDNYSVHMPLNHLVGRKNLNKIEILDKIDKPKKLEVEKQIERILNEYNDHFWSNYKYTFNNIKFNGLNKQGISITLIEPEFDKEKKMEIIKLIDTYSVFGLNENMISPYTKSFSFDNPKLRELMNKFPYITYSENFNVNDLELILELRIGFVIQYFLQIFNIGSKQPIIPYLIQYALPYFASPLNVEKLKHTEFKQNTLIYHLLEYNFLLLYRGSTSLPRSNVARANLVPYIKNSISILKGDKNKIALSYLILFAVDRRNDYLMFKTFRQKVPTLKELANAQASKKQKEEIFKTITDYNEFSENNFLTEKGYHDNYIYSTQELHGSLEYFEIELNEKQYKFIQDCIVLFKSPDLITDRNDLDEKFDNLISSLNY